MRKLLALLMISLLAPLAAGADDAPSGMPTPLQVCTIDADLHGDATYFFVHGEDSWTGTVTLNCAAPPMTMSRAVTAIFNSKGVGIGARESNSTIHIAMTLETTLTPDRVRVQMPVNNTSTTDSVTWAFETGLQNATVQVTSSDSKFLPSLQSGTLIIQ